MSSISPRASRVSIMANNATFSLAALAQSPWLVPAAKPKAARCGPKDRPPIGGKRAACTSCSASCAEFTIGQMIPSAPQSRAFAISASQFRETRTMATGRPAAASSRRARPAATACKRGSTSPTPCWLSMIMASRLGMVAIASVSSGLSAKIHAAFRAPVRDDRLRGTVPWTLYARREEHSAAAGFERATRATTRASAVVAIDLSPKEVRGSPPPLIINHSS